MTLRTGFAAALQFVRKNKGFTQEDFSNVSSRTYLSSLERALKSPTLDKVEEIACVLQVHPVTLIVLAAMQDERKDLEQLVQQVNNEVHALRHG